MAYGFLNVTSYERDAADAADVAALIDRTVREIKIPYGVTKIGKNAFYACEDLVKVEIPDSVAYIDNGAFWLCNNLVDFSIPYGVTTIGNTAFNGVGRNGVIDKLVIPDSVTSLGGDAFSASGVKRFIVSKNLNKIESGTFGGILACEAYDFSRHESVPVLANVNAFDSMIAYNKARILVPAALYDEWIEATNWATYKDYIVPVGGKAKPDQSKFNVYVDADTLKEIVDYNLLGTTLSKGVGKSEIRYEGDVPYLRIYGDGVSSEACASLPNIEGKTTGKYLVFAYRLPATNVETYTDMQVFATTGGASITGSGDMFYMAAEKDSKWHVGVVDIEEAIKSSKWVADGSNSCKFNPSSDGTYTISRLRLDWFNKVTSKDSYIDVAYVGICDSLQKAISADPDYEGKEFDAHYFSHAPVYRSVKGNDKGMPYVTITSPTNGSGETGIYLYSLSGEGEATMLGSGRYIGIMYRNAPGSYCEFHSNSSGSLTDSRWYSRQHLTYEIGSDWKFTVFELKHLNTVCRSLRFDFFNALSKNTHYSIDIAFVKFFASRSEAQAYYEDVCNKYEIYDGSGYGLEYGPSGIIDSEYAVSGRGIYTGSTIVVPESYNGCRVSEIMANAFEGDSDIDTLILPETGVYIGSLAFYGTGLRVIKNFSSGHMDALGGVTIEYVSMLDNAAINNGVLAYLEGSPTYDFSRHTSVADLSGIYGITVGDDTKIVVPDELYDEWINDTNWAYYADHICKSSEYDGQF